MNKNLVYIIGILIICEIIARSESNPEAQFIFIQRRNERDRLAAEAVERANVEARNAVERANAEARNQVAREVARRQAAEAALAAARTTIRTTPRPQQF